MNKVGLGELSHLIKLQGVPPVATARMKIRLQHQDVLASNLRRGKGGGRGNRKVTSLESH